MAPGVAESLELLQMRQLAHVDLRGEMALDRILEGLARAQNPAREGPGAFEGLSGAFPEQNLELVPSDLKDDRESLVLRCVRGKLSH
jgi:hypothetical protein